MPALLSPSIHAGYIVRHSKVLALCWAMHKQTAFGVPDCQACEIQHRQSYCASFGFDGLALSSSLPSEVLPSGPLDVPISSTLSFWGPTSHHTSSPETKGCTQERWSLLPLPGQLPLSCVVLRDRPTLQILCQISPAVCPCLGLTVCPPSPGH